jgi:hypothetical protein
MTQLVPCPECQRHVRKTESRCPFCEARVSLAHVAPPVLPSRRLGRAATFAFGATLVGATSLTSCSDEDSGPGTAVYGGPPVAGAGGEPIGQGGSSADGGADSEPQGGMTTIYGSPPGGGAGGAEHEVGGSGPVNAGGEGGAAPVYGGPPGGGGSGGDG